MKKIPKNDWESSDEIHEELHRIFGESDSSTSKNYLESTWLNIKSILITSIILAITLFILIASLVTLPILIIIGM